MLDVLNSRLSLGARLGLLTALFVAPTALLSTLFISTTSSEIAFAEREVEGATYVSEVWPTVVSGGDISAPSHTVAR